MGEDEPKDLEIVIADGVMQQMANDPEMAEAVRGINAVMRQAWAGVQRGHYASFDEAMLKLTGYPVEKYDAETGEKVEGALMQREIDGRIGVPGFDEDEG